MWAEVMEIYRPAKVRLKLSPDGGPGPRKGRKDFMQEDVDAGLILAFMQETTEQKVCSKQLFREAPW